MDRKARIETEWSVLNRIVATLLALADLAERVAEATIPARFVVLMALQHADMVVKDFLSGSIPGGLGSRRSRALFRLRHGFEPVDALNLALSLRQLAFAVRRMAARSGHHFGAGHGDAGGDAVGPFRRGRCPHKVVQEAVRRMRRSELAGSAFDDSS